MALSIEQKQTRFLAIVLPSLTLCTHTLLTLSFLLPGSDLDRACFSVAYNTVAGSASILGLVGAIRIIPRCVSAYTIVHAITLSFATLALVNLILPFDFRLPNPVIPSYAVDGSSICRDIDVGFGLDDEWLEKCSASLVLIKFAMACLGLTLMIAQWWALVSVWGWGQELRHQRITTGETDEEKAGLVEEEDVMTYDEKTGF